MSALLTIVYRVRMAVTYEFSKYVPSVHTGRVPPQRKETEEWRAYQCVFGKS